MSENIYKPHIYVGYITPYRWKRNNSQHWANNVFTFTWPASTDSTVYLGLFPVVLTCSRKIGKPGIQSNVECFGQNEAV